MIIRGGQIFILDDDTMQGVTITGAQVVLDVPENASLEEMQAYLVNRVGGGSVITGCSLMPMAKWANQKASESIGTAKSYPHLKQAPLMQRIRKFLCLDKKCTP